MVYSNTEVYGGKWVWQIRSLVVYFFESLDDVFEVHFFRASFLHLVKDTHNMYGHIAKISLKCRHC